MNELIRITTNEQGSDVVSARELHEFLEVKSRFNDWIKNRIIKYGFLEDTDYVALTKNLVSGGIETDYALTLDMAKELSMVERNEKGKQARQYFIEAEKRLKQVVVQVPSTEQVLIQLMNQSNQILSNQQQLINQLRADVDQIMTNQRLPEPTEGRRSVVPRLSRDMRQAVTRKVNEYCGIHGVTQHETYTYLYKRMQQIYLIDVRRLRRVNGESFLDAIERYGHIEKLYGLVMAELAYFEE